MWVHRYGFGRYRYRSSCWHPPQTHTHATGQAGSVPIWAWSILHFEQGRWGLLEGKEPLRLTFQAREGRGVVGRKRPPPSRISSEGGEGGGWKEMAPSVSHFKRGRGGGWLEGNGPLHLAFQAREGRGVVGRKRPPPSRISSKGGEGVVGRKRPPLSRISSKGGLLEELVSV